MPTPVGRTAATASGGSSFTWTRSCAVGNTLVMFVQHSTSGVTNTAVTDTAGNTWTKLQSTNDLSATSQRNIDLWICVPTTAITSITITSSAASAWVVSAEDFAGALTVQDSGKYFGTGHTLPAVNTIAGGIVAMCIGYSATTAGTQQLVAASPLVYEGLANLSFTQQESFVIGTGATTTGSYTPSITTNPTIGAVYVAFGPVVGPNQPPTITGPGVVNVTGTTASLTFQGSDTDGTISSFACVHQSNTANTVVTPTIGPGVVTNPGTANASVTFPISGLTANAKYLFGSTATDNAGAVSATTVATVCVTRDAPDIRSVTVVGFTVVGGGTALECIQAGIAQAAAGQPVTRYLESASPPGGASVTVTFQPATPSSLAKAFAFPVRAKDTTSTETATVTLKMNDSTTIATRGPFTLTTTAAACGGTTTTGTGSESAAITDHSKLSIVVVTN